MSDTAAEQVRRQRCRCGVYMDCHQRIHDHSPRRGSRVHLWLRDHAVSAHVVAPIWVRIPERWRWKIVYLLNRSQRRCWSSLVDAALTTWREGDLCDVRTPLGCGSGDCGSTCYWGGGSVRGDHIGSHTCQCYCGKFCFTASEGYDDRPSPIRSAKPDGPTS